MALILARLLLSLVTVAGPAAVAAPQPEARPRIVQLAPRAKVTTVSSGADEVIEVEFSSVPPLYAVPIGIETGAQAIEHAAAQSDVIVLAVIQRLAGRLIEEDTWIATDATAAVIDLVSGSHRAGGLKPGDHFTFTERGGEIIDRRTTIRTKSDPYTPMRVGGRYLLFLSRGSDAADVPAFDVVTRLEITRNGTVRDTIVPRKAQAWQTRMTGLSVDQAVAAARSAPLRARILQQRAGIPLSARITPDDRIILLQRAPSPAQQHEGQVDPGVPPDVALTMLTGLSAAVAVIDVTSSTARLVEGESWLATITSARIVDAIKPGSHYRSLKPGPLTIEDDGGEMRIQNAIVHTSTDGGLYREAYVPGRRYLVFMTFHPARDAAVSLAAYEVRAGGTLRDLFAGSKGLDYRQQLDGLALTQTVETIRRLTRAGY